MNFIQSFPLVWDLYCVKPYMLLLLPAMLIFFLVLKTKLLRIRRRPYNLIYVKKNASLQLDKKNKKIFNFIIRVKILWMKYIRNIVYVWFAFIWSIQLHRNNIIFKCNIANVEYVMNLIKFRFWFFDNIKFKGALGHLLQK